LVVVFFDGRGLISRFHDLGALFTPFSLLQIFLELGFSFILKDFSFGGLGLEFGLRFLLDSGLNGVIVVDRFDVISSFNRLLPAL
jgi:hypothetical protein